MKKLYLACLPVLLAALCGCAEGGAETQTRFLLDTVASVTAECDTQTLDEAFDLCADYEKLFSRTVKDSDVSRLNAGNTEKVNKDTSKVIERALHFCALSGGRYDITICPVSMLWDFKNEVIPSKDEIAEALKNVDYHSITVDKDTVSLGGKQIDLGSIAKGFIADEMTAFLKQKGVKNGIVNLGGNVSVFGREYTVGIKKPFEEGNAAVMRLSDCSAATSGIYERYIEKDGIIYHHVLDPETGYGVQNSLASVTVVGKCSMDCDALSTVLLLEGDGEGMKTVESIDGYEAVFILRNGEIKMSSGFCEKDGELILK